jgi:Holliday junction resolvasome RuvABC DNA-binding subunit
MVELFMILCNKFAAIEMKDLDSIQSIPGVMAATAEEMALALRVQYDSSIAGLYSGVSTAQTLDLSSTGIDSGNVKEVIEFSNIKDNIVL